ncbi:MAG TPA: PAS domain-containing protein, partial [Chitinophagaceae bacterium]|nr:PAS domain-containing protein [Chitinophagaceae bacterium]
MSKRSLYLYILAFCLFVSAGIVRYFMFEEMRQFTRKVERSREVVTALATLSSHFKSAQIYSPSTEHIAENLYRSYRQDMDRVPGELDHLKRLLRDSPEQWYLIDTVDRMIRTHLEVLSGMNLVEMLRSTESWRVGLLYRINIMINQMVVRENRLLAEWRGDLDRSARISDIISFGLNGIALIVIIATFISNLRLSQRGTYLEGFLESVINTSRSGIISYDAVRERGRLVDFRVSFVNQAAENLLGISGTEVQGKQLRDLPSFVRDTGLYERFSRVAEGGAPEELEIRYDRNGQQRWLYILITRRGQGLTVSFHDISTLKDYEARLKETIRELEQSNASLEQYAYAASHDLQEPLRKIQTFGSRLQEAE